MTQKIKISELFYSIQGEGQYVGVPSIFLRTFGCNFTCSQFGMPIGQDSTERDTVAANIDQYLDYKDLPLVETGCDSYASWDPRFKHLSPMLTIDAIIDRFAELLTEGTFNKNKHLIITGGEPLLGWQRSYPELLEKCLDKLNLTHLTFETNGTQPLHDDLKVFLGDNRKWIETTFSVSAKLPCSGEKWEDAILPAVVRDYLDVSNSSYLKFVVSTQTDVDDALVAIDEYKKGNVDIPVYLMPVGGVNSVYELNERQVADFCRDNGLRFSPRIQVPLYKNQWGT